MISQLAAPISHGIIFGSATNYSCWWGSDIDVCLVGVDASYNTKPLRVPGQAYDFIFYKNLEELRKQAHAHGIEKEIWEKGVVVYGNRNQESRNQEN